MTGTRTPYDNLPPAAFWRTAVAGRDADSITDLYCPKFPIDRVMKIAMAGSCFAQRLGRHLRARGFAVIDREPPPPGLTPEEETQYGFGLYSARYGNIYTARQLRQLTEEAFGQFAPANSIWEKGGCYFDALRPSIEPEGLASQRAVREQRRYHLRQVREVITSADVFVFTLGLTETWTHAKSGTVYPTAPGVICGAYDSRIHAFRNFTAEQTFEDLRKFFALAKTHNPGMKLLLTVSPQRPVATASGKHVLSAAGYSKAALRAAAGQMECEHADVDYFPSYEFVTNPLAGNRYFNPNLRTISEEGTSAVMDVFLAAHEIGSACPAPSPAPVEETEDTPHDMVCEEELLDAFAT